MFPVALILGGLVASLSALAVGWAVLMPLLMAFSERFDGIEKRVLKRQYA